MISLNQNIIRHKFSRRRTYRIGYGHFSLAQLKIIQEVIALGVFIPFAMFYMDQPFKLDFLWAGLCLLGAVYFMFR